MKTGTQTIKLTEDECLTGKRYAFEAITNKRLINFFISMKSNQELDQDKINEYIERYTHELYETELTKTEYIHSLLNKYLDNFDDFANISCHINFERKEMTVSYDSENR